MITIRAYQKQRTLRLALLEGKGRRGVKKIKNKGFGSLAELDWKISNQLGDRQETLDYKQ